MRSVSNCSDFMWFQVCEVSYRGCFVFCRTGSCFHDNLELAAQKFHKFESSIVYECFISQLSSCWVNMLTLRLDNSSTSSSVTLQVQLRHPVQGIIATRSSAVAVVGPTGGWRWSWGSRIGYDVYVKDEAQKALLMRNEKQITCLGDAQKKKGVPQTWRGEVSQDFSVIIQCMVDQRSTVLQHTVLHISLQGMCCTRPASPYHMKRGTTSVHKKFAWISMVPWYYLVEFSWLVADSPYVMVSSI